MESWRLLDTGVGDAAWNMALDEALFRGFEEDSRPVLRLYRWEPSLTLGRFQPRNGAVEPERARESGISVVRRITGGGALVHGGDLSYALVVPRSFVGELGVKESYRHLCGFLFRLYEALGLSPRFAGGTGERSPVCLASNEPYDILIKEGKMGGNAQRHGRNLLFQHGSIPMTLDAARFAPLFPGESGLDAAATLERLGVALSAGRLSKLLAEAFSETFGVRLVSDGVYPKEERLAEELLAKKYGTEEWNRDGTGRAA